MLSLGTKDSCINWLVASSMKTSSVQGSSAALFEPSVLAAVDLDQLAVMLAPKPGLMERAPLPRARAYRSSSIIHLRESLP